MNRERHFYGKAKIKPATESLLLPYQRDWIVDNSRLKIAEKSRQIGWTWATAYSLVRRKCRKNELLDAWVSSRDELQARLFLEDCKKFAALLHTAATCFNSNITGEKNKSAQFIEFSNGRRIYSLSSNPDAQAGKRGDRVLDEFALNPDPRKLYAIAYPGITWGGQLEIFSTHRGSANFFNQLIREVKEKGNPKGFSLHTVTLQKALEQGFLYKLQQKLPPDDSRQEMDETDYFNFIRSGCPDEESFLQEYCCVPADDSSAFFPYELIDGCIYAAGEQWQIGDPENLSKNAQIYIGVDLGREHDLTVIWALELLGDTLFTRAVETFFKTAFESQEAALWRWLQLNQTRRCCIDQTGLGLQFVERAKKRFGYKVEGVHFTSAVKESLVYPVKMLFETRKIRIPGDPSILSDLRSIKKIVTSAGNMRFDSERGDNGHSDRFWALALAVHAKKNNTAPVISVV
ncbi:MAG: terminase large subunit domain-containing protein [Verrucomicrobiia bacterium]